MPRERLSSLAIAAREAMAFARQGWLLRHDATAPVLPEEADHGDDVVVLLHGLFATAGVLRPLREALSRPEGPGLAKRGRARVHTATFPYFPGPGVEELASRLAKVVDAIPEGARVHLVGHSLGGIVARFYAQESRSTRIAQTISMASPFGGVPAAAWLGIDSTRDLTPMSPVLRRILHGSSAVTVPHLSIIAGADNLVRSPVSHALPGGDVVVLEGRGHNTLLFDEEAARVVERRVIERRHAMERARADEARHHDDAEPRSQVHRRAQ